MLALFLLPKQVFATVPLPVQNGYVINSFDSQIEINKDTSLTVIETIQATFTEAKHGIYRVIPVIYSANGKTINARFQLLSVTQDGKTIPYETSRLAQSIKIKIGDPNKTFMGPVTYEIKYKIHEVLLRYSDHDEVYWNVIGGEWDTLIEKASAQIISPYAEISKITCYQGTSGGKDQNCQTNFSKDRANFSSTINLYAGSDFTVVTGLNSQNQLLFPNIIQRQANFITDNFGYLIALFPITVLFIVWYKTGRDKRFLSDNVFTQPEDNKQRNLGIFEREHLPLAYTPIKNITPAQLGTILDEKVDTKDIVAEIIELARLGFLTIQRTEVKKLFGKKTDYIFTNNNKDASQLKKYQKYLLDHIFDTQLEDKDLSLFLKDDTTGIGKSFVNKALTGKIQTTSLSKLKNHFYSHLETIKRDLYENMKSEKMFTNNPSGVRTLWGLLYTIMMVLCFFGVTFFTALTANGGPMFIFFPTIIPAIFLIKNMSQRTAWGHSLYRQATGLKYYINVGKWREEIAEKNLFLEEILPLAICLGVVDKLANDLQDLGLEPPNYLNGFTTAAFANDMSHFNSSAATNIVSSPAPSGHSSWSGGSGFSGGGSSGGGFGGGGGGSW